MQLDRLLVFWVQYQVPAGLPGKSERFRKVFMLFSEKRKMLKVSEFIDGLENRQRETWLLRSTFGPHLFELGYWEFPVASNSNPVLLINHLLSAIWNWFLFPLAQHEPCIFQLPLVVIRTPARQLCTTYLENHIWIFHRTLILYSGVLLIKKILSIMLIAY